MLRVLFAFASTISQSLWLLIFLWITGSSPVLACLTNAGVKKRFRNVLYGCGVVIPITELVRFKSYFVSLHTKDCCIGSTRLHRPNHLNLTSTSSILFIEGSGDSGFATAGVVQHITDTDRSEWLPCLANFGIKLQVKYDTTQRISTWTPITNASIQVYATGDMSTILATCLSSRLVQGQTNSWLYQDATLSMGKPHEILGFTSRLPHLSTNYVLSLTICLVTVSPTTYRLKR